MITINHVISRSDEVFQNVYSPSTKGRWLAEFEKRVWNEVFSKFEGGIDMDPAIHYPEDGDKPLLIPDEYVPVYEYYLLMKINFHDRNWKAYNAALSMFQSAYADFKAWWVQNHSYIQQSSFIHVFP